MRNCAACGHPAGPNHPCPDCGGHAGHTIRCPRGPGSAQEPTVGEIEALLRVLEWPAVEVRLPAGKRIRVEGRPPAWGTFLRWCEIRPSYARATWAALEAFEETYRAQAPTAAEVVG